MDADLASRLGRATTPGEACAAVVDALLDRGLALPSLYLERGGRLRCQAVRGYWQVYDGMPADAGVIGQVFRTGEPVHLRAGTGDEHYLTAVAEVIDEVCVPIVCGHRVVGVLNVEATAELPPATVALLTGVAAAFAVRLAALGGPPEESGAQRLARHATALAGVDRAEQLLPAILGAARDLCGVASAVLLFPTPHDGLRVVASDGPIGRRLAASRPSDLDPLVAWIETGTSCWTHGDTHGAGADGQRSLRAAGVASMALVPVTTAHGTGALLVAEERAWPFATEVVELLELLGAHAGACLRTLDALERLRRQASCDPLTGLGHHGAHRDALDAALGAADRRRLVAVVMLDLDGFKRINDTLGHPVGDRLLCRAADALGAVLRDDDRLYRVGGDEFAAILHVADEAEARALTERLHAAAGARLGGTTISAGVAVARRGESSADLIARADRALYAVKDAGRDGVALAGEHRQRAAIDPAAARVPA